MIVRALEISPEDLLTFGGVGAGVSTAHFLGLLLVILHLGSGNLNSCNSGEDGPDHIAPTTTLDGKFRIPVPFLDTTNTPDYPLELR